MYHKPRFVGPTPDTTPVQGDDTGDKFTQDETPEPKPYPEPRPDFLFIKEGSLDDEIRAREIILVGPEGLTMDRKVYREKWGKKVIELRKSDPSVEKIFGGEELADEEWEALARRLNSPEYYFNEESLARAFEQPTGSLSDFIRVALGLDRFLTREERIEKAFNTWVVEHSSSVNPAQAQMLRLLKARVMTGEEITLRLFSQPPFSLWGGLTRMEQLFGKEQLLQMVDGLNALLAA
jgi:type I restriction enzyme R subunit